nr:hypothetical protein [Enterovibrio coralii]
MPKLRFTAGQDYGNDYYLDGTPKDAPSVIAQPNLNTINAAADTTLLLLSTLQQALSYQRHLLPQSQPKKVAQCMNWTGSSAFTFSITCSLRQI